jgi:hypothetical protein
VVDLIARWDALELGFAADRYDGHARLLRAWAPYTTHLGHGVFLLPPTHGPAVVVTAAHGTNHTRDGAAKWADRGTGSLALLLAETTGCAALVAVGAPGDGNHDLTHPIKDALLTLALGGIETVVDLHGSAHLPDSPDIDLGTSAGYTPKAFIDALTSHDRVRVAINAARAAASPRRITTLAQAHGLRAVQLEIDALLRPPTGTAGRREDLVTALTGAILTLAPHPGTPRATAGNAPGRAAPGHRPGRTIPE